jgi:DNA-binding beta-propeller fold protein YncE
MSNTILAARSSATVRSPIMWAAIMRLLAIALLVAACGDGATDRRGAASAADGPRLVPEAQEVYRIGSVDGDGWDAFSRIVSAGFDAAGRLHLLDAGSRTVTVVDHAGDFVRTTGRPGDGPGEHRMPVAMAVLQDGRVVVSDAGHRALQLFDADGAFVRAIPLGDGVAPPVALFPHGEDGVVYVERRLAMMGPMAGRGRGGPGAQEAPGDATTAALRRLAVNGTGPGEVVGEAWLPPREPPRVSGGAGGTTMVRRALRAFDPQIHLAVLPDGGIAVADSTTYRIRVLDPARGETRTLEGAATPVAVTDRERDAERARRLEELEAGGGGPAQVTMMGMAGGGQAPAQVPRSVLEAQLETLTFWPEIQVIQRLAADPDGRLWVQRFGGVGEPGPVDILTADGGTLATIPAGAVPVPVAFGPDGLAAWVERDDLDVPVVRVARLGGLP